VVGVDCGPARAVDAGDEAAEKEQFAVELFRVVGRWWETERIREKRKKEKRKEKIENEGKKGMEKINGKNKKNEKPNECGGAHHIPIQ
jgi:hypothetical protein